MTEEHDAVARLNFPEIRKRIDRILVEPLRAMIGGQQSEIDALEGRYYDLAARVEALEDGVVLPPMPPDAPDAPPTDPGDDGGDFDPRDAVDPTSVVFLGGPDGLAAWPIVTEVSRVDIYDRQQICIAYGSPAWPAIDGVVGNPWIGAQVGGVWYMGSFEWLRPGQQCKALGVPGEHATIAEALGPHIKQAPLESWRPQPGEEVLVMVTSLARAGQTSVNERSNIVRTTWPG